MRCRACGLNHDGTRVEWRRSGSEGDGKEMAKKDCEHSQPERQQVSRAPDTTTGAPAWGRDDLWARPTVESAGHIPVLPGPVYEYPVVAGEPHTDAYLPDGVRADYARGQQMHAYPYPYRYPPEPPRGQSPHRPPLPRWGSLVLRAVLFCIIGFVGFIGLLLALDTPASPGRAGTTHGGHIGGMIVSLVCAPLLIYLVISSVRLSIRHGESARRPLR